MALTCPSCGNDQNFLVKTLQMHIVQLRDSRVEANEEGRPAVFDRNVNGWVQVPTHIKLPDNQQDRDMLARELLIRFQMSKSHPLIDLRDAYAKF